MSSRSKPVCLIIEPEWGWRNLLNDILETNGMETLCYTTEADALKFLKTPESKRVHVVLCQAPPAGAKHSLVGKIRSAKASKDIPVICLSPSSALQDRAQAFEQGATDYLVRPVSPVTLLERITFWASRVHRPF